MTLTAAAPAVTATASSASLAISQRVRPQPWVQDSRNVPVSSSLATIGPPVRAPIRIGITVSTPTTTCAPE